MELVELWLCDLVIFLNNGRSGDSGNVCNSLTLGSDDGGGGGGIIELASLLVELGSLVLSSWCAEKNKLKRYLYTVCPGRIL